MPRAHGFCLIAMLAIAGPTLSGSCAALAVEPLEARGASESTTFTVDRNDYKGTLWVGEEHYDYDPNHPSIELEHDGTTPVVIEAGARLGGPFGSSTFTVTPRDGGLVVSPASAATVSGTKLTLNTVEIGVRRGAYKNGYLKFSGYAEKLSGRRVRLIQGLVYSVETGGAIGGTTFSVVTRTSPRGPEVWTNSTSATSGDPHRLRLQIRTTRVRIDPGAGVQWKAASYADAFTGANDVDLVPGVKCVLMVGKSTGTFEPKLTPGAVEQVDVGGTPFSITHDVGQMP